MDILRQQIAYRCPECGTATIGFLGGLRSVSDMLRLKCECDKFALEIKGTKDGKIGISVPCVFCKDTHSYTVSPDLFHREGATRLPCPHSHHDIFFIADDKTMAEELDRSAKELSFVLSTFEAESLEDIQPMDVDTAEAAPDPTIYDTLNFVVRDLEDAGKVICPCKKGPYELRFTDTGMQLSCGGCGATYEFHAMSGASAEMYLDITEIKLS